MPMGQGEKGFFLRVERRLRFESGLLVLILLVLLGDPE
jgi:hypothetical protein